MAAQELISVVIPCYNPPEAVLDTIASVEGQTHGSWEIIVVDDGTDQAGGHGLLERVSGLAPGRLTLLRQENRGLAAARNSGMRAAKGRYVVPLDADDLLEPRMMEVCLAELEAHPEAAFAYFDYRVFGEKNYLERPGPYNLYRLLEENYFAYCCLLRKQAWEACGGYDEWHRWGYEDWSFFLNLGKHGLFGRYIPEPLFRYRAEGRGLHYIGLERHQSNWAHMEEQHPELLSAEGRLVIKRAWSPSLCFVAQGPRAPAFENQSLRDFQVLQNVNEQQALERSPAEAFLWLSGPRELRPEAAEECLWALQHADWVTWTDTGDAPPPTLRNFAGPLGVSREAMARPEPKASGDVRRLPWACRGRESKAEKDGERQAAPPATQATAPPAAPLQSRPWPAPVARLRRHLANADLTSWRSWVKHPLRSAARLIPLRVKERVNRLFRREVFDLSFYLQFQPRSVLVGGRLVEPLDYIPVAAPEGKLRVALCTPHLGYGGAENVLLEFARQFDRERFELTVLAVQGRDRHLLQEWLRVADWVWDLSRIVPAEAAPQALYSMGLNWGWNLLILQNSAAAYRVLPELKAQRPSLRVADILHAVDEDWDFFEATLDVAGHIDRRVVISEAGRQRLIDMAIPEETIRLIRNGVDLEHFRKGERPVRFQRSPAPHVGFVGRLQEGKRPLLLVEIARELRRLRRGHDVRFVVAGSGPEEDRLRSAVASANLTKRFRLLGHVRDVAEVLRELDVLVIPSKGEGIPLALIEALAMEVPVVACRTGAIEEALPAECGIMVEPGPGEETRLAEALLEVLNDPERRRRMGAAGRGFVERHYSLETARRRYRELMEELASQRAAVG